MAPIGQRHLILLPRPRPRRQCRRVKFIRIDLLALPLACLLQLLVPARSPHDQALNQGHLELKLQMRKLFLLVT